MTTTCGVIEYEELVAYWAGELPERDVDRLDEHLMGCAVCTSASVGVAEIAGALRDIMSPFVTHAELESLRAVGRRIRENPVGPGERRAVVFDAETDVLIHRLTGLKLEDAIGIDVAVSVEETGQVMLREPDVPFDRDSGELLVACQRHFAALPPNVVFEARVRHATGPDHVARYVVPHVFQPPKT
jgi:hypothetical protein